MNSRSLRAAMLLAAESIAPPDTPRLATTPSPIKPGKTYVRKPIVPALDTNPEGRGARRRAKRAMERNR